MSHVTQHLTDRLKAPRTSDSPAESHPSRRRPRGNEDHPGRVRRDRDCASGSRRRPARVRAGHVEWLIERLSDRDWLVLRDVNRLRLIDSGQIERLHFGDVAEPARGRTRRRSLARLVEWRVLTMLERRIGGVRAGSAGMVFALDSGGQRVLQMTPGGHLPPVPDNGGDGVSRGARADGRTGYGKSDGDDIDHDYGTRRVRRPGVPTELFVRHTLAVSELYVRLVEAVRQTPGARLMAFDAEPGSWWPDGLGGLLKPDAYVTLEYGEVVDHWWVEVDRAKESLPVIHRKLRRYMEFARRGEAGPGGVVPRVVVTVPDAGRLRAVHVEVEGLAGFGQELICAMEHSRAPATLLETLLAP